MRNNIEKASCLIRGLIVGALAIVILNSMGHVITVQVLPSMLPMLEVEQ